MDDYAKYSAVGDGEKIKGVADELKTICRFHLFRLCRIPWDIMPWAHIYYDQKEYKEAGNYLLRYADKEPKSNLAPLALLKAAIALEEANDLKGALEIYKRLEDKYCGQHHADQIFFNAARVYAKDERSRQFAELL